MRRTAAFIPVAVVVATLAAAAPPTPPPATRWSGSPCRTPRSTAHDSSPLARSRRHQREDVAALARSTRSSPGCRRSAACRRRSSRRATPTSRSKSGCPPRGGTASSRVSATAVGPARSATPPWRQLSRAGYATASTDTGHVGGTAAFAQGHPEKLVDFGYRAIHEMTVHAKSVTESFYGSSPKLSLFNGCSLGGRQAITEAIRYPADYTRHHRRRADDLHHAGPRRRASP